MVAVDENALICDFAETYHIFNFKALDVRTASILASGLRDDSRIKMKLAGRKIALSEEIQAAMYDCVRWLQWSKTEDGSRNRNHPKSLLDELTATEAPQKRVEVYDSGEEFMTAWEKITKDRR